MDNEWKKSLRERFSDYAAPEPEGLWEGIEQGIAGKPRRKMLPVWIASGLAAAAAVALVVFLHPEKTLETPALQSRATLAESLQDDAVVVDTAATSSPAATPTTSSPARTGDLEAAPVASTSVPFAVVSRHTLVAEADVVQQMPAAPVDGMKTFPETISFVVELDRKVSTEEVEDFVQSVVDDAFEQAAVDDSFDVEAQKTPRKRFSIGAYGNGGQASNEQMQGYGMNRTGQYLGTRATGSNVKNDVGGLMRTLASNRASNFEAHHSAPLRVGVTAAWELMPHLNLVSGLNWTYLNSEFEESANPIRTVVGQDLGYLGIPLRLETGFNVWKGLWLSAGVGGMVEKGLMSSSRTNTWVDGQLAETVKNPKPDTGGLLWSVGATAGAEYRYSPSFALYVTPGIEYHFDNGAEVRSAYTEKPLHWNVNLGVRFHFGN